VLDLAQQAISYRIENAYFVLLNVSLVTDMLKMNALDANLISTLNLEVVLKIALKEHL